MISLAEKSTMSEAKESIKDILRGSDSSVKEYLTLSGRNLGNGTLLTSLPFQTFFQQSEVANERGLERLDIQGEKMLAQRKLDPAHAAGLGSYMLRGVVSATVSLCEEQKEDTHLLPKLREFQAHLGTQPYMALQPIVTNIRTCSFGGGGLRVERGPEGTIKVFLSETDILWVVDGQHRLYGMKMLFEFFKDIREKHRYAKRPKLYTAAHGNDLNRDELAAWLKVFTVYRSYCSVMVETHLGLSAEQERQLFHDLNNLGKKVEAGLVFDFDRGNPINLFIKEELIVREDEGGFWKPQILEKDITNWDEDPGGISRKDVIAVSAVLFLNKTNIKGAQPVDVEEKKAVALRFWESVNNIPHFGEPHAKDHTVAAQPVVLKALGKLVQDFAFGRKRNEEWLSIFFDGIEKIDFSHSNPMWTYYEMSADERKRKGLTGLQDYLPEDTEGNRDIGKPDAMGRMRFGAKHNDIFPIIGDMIRWKLGLPTRSARE